MVRGLVKVPRSIRKWNPVVSHTGKSYRATLTHPKDPGSVATALGETAALAMHGAQHRATLVYYSRSAERSSLQFVASNPGSE